MARVVFHSAAYWGDVMPYVPVANELVARGHEVVYALPEGHHRLLAGERFDLADSGNPFSPDRVVDDPEHSRLLERNGIRFGGALTGRYYTYTWLVPYLREGVEALTRIGKDADLFVTHPTSAVVTRIAAESLDVPMLTGHLFPMIVDTATRIPAPVRAVGGLFVGDREINAVRREHGVPPLRFNATEAGAHDGMLLLWSDHFAPRGRRWSPTWRFTGFTLWDGPSSAGVDAAVEGYLESGEPPVVVTFGSSTAMVAQKLFETLAVRLDDLGVRALFLVGDERNVPPWMRDRADVFAFAPLTRVLPRCRAIVHSGSHGTNAAALTAGTPSITIPLLIDQAWNARRAQTLGLGRMVKGARRRTVRIWDALDDVLGDDGYATRARAFASLLAGEDGVTAAADAIEEHLPAG